MQRKTASCQRSNLTSILNNKGLNYLDWHGNSKTWKQPIKNIWTCWQNGKTTLLSAWRRRLCHKMVLLLSANIGAEALELSSAKVETGALSRKRKAVPLPWYELMEDFLSTTTTLEKVCFVQALLGILSSLLWLLLVPSRFPYKAYWDNALAKLSAPIDKVFVQAEENPRPRWYKIFALT